jgi:hypothetical protein
MLASTSSPRSVPSLSVNERLPSPVLLAPQQQAFVQQLSNQFANATWRMAGTNTVQVKEVLKKVHDSQSLPAFNKTLAATAWQEGRLLPNAVAVLNEELAGTEFSRLVKRASLLESMDALLYGKNSYRARPWDYRLLGAWSALTNFWDVCKQHPVMSSLVIGSVAYFGGKYPFLGGISGVGIMGWSGVAMAAYEHKASKNPGAMNTEKAEAYLESGENAMAFLLTASGGDGIVKGVLNGAKVFAEATNGVKAQGVLARWLLPLTQACKATMQEGEHVGLRFVVGLFDNVLLPFNWAAEQWSARNKRS